MSEKLDKAFGRFWAIPTWMLTNIINWFLPRDHPWHHKYFELHDWADSRTDLTEKFDSVFWGWFVSMLIIFCN